MSCARGHSRVGDPWPSVTRILAAAGLGPDYAMVPPAVLEAARARGSAVHEAIEALHLGYEYDLLPEGAPYLAAYRRFAQESGFTPERVEFRVESTTWRYCGHPDVVGWLLGKRTMLDYKGMDTVHLRSAARQLAGYRLAWNEQHPTETLDLCAVLQLKPDGSYRLHEVDAAAKESVFLAAVVVWWESYEEDAA